MLSVMNTMRMRETIEPYGQNLWMLSILRLKLINIITIPQNIVITKKNYEKYANEVKNSDQHFRELLDICNLELKFNNNKVERNQIGYEDFQFSTYNSPHLNDKYRINYNSKVTIHAYFKMLKQQRALLINIMDRYFMSLKIPKKWRGRFLDFCYSRSTKYYHEFYILKVLNNKNWSPKCDLNEWRNIKQKIEA